jgi:hypothetical protein
MMFLLHLYVKLFCRPDQLTLPASAYKAFSTFFPDKFFLPAYQDANGNALAEPDATKPYVLLGAVCAYSGRYLLTKSRRG